MIVYFLQAHLPSGEVYVLRYDGESITGVCGPLHYAEWSDDGGYTVKVGFDRSNGEFNTEDAVWANAQEWGHPLH